MLLIRWKTTKQTESPRHGGDGERREVFCGARGSDSIQRLMFDEEEEEAGCAWFGTLDFGAFD